MSEPKYKTPKLQKIHEAQQEARQKIGRPRIYPSVICEKCGKELGATTYARHMQKEHPEE